MGKSKLIGTVQSSMCKTKNTTAMSKKMQKLGKWQSAKYKFTKDTCGNFMGNQYKKVKLRN